MNKTITIRGIHETEATKLSNAIRNYINENFDKQQKLLAYVKEPVYIDVTVDVIKPHPNHIVSFRIHGPHFEVIIKKEGPEMYKVIDNVLDLITQKLIEHKGKIMDLKKTADRYK